MSHQYSMVGVGRLALILGILYVLPVVFGDHETSRKCGMLFMCPTFCMKAKNGCYVCECGVFAGYLKQASNEVERVASNQNTQTGSLVSSYNAGHHHETGSGALYQSQSGTGTSGYKARIDSAYQAPQTDFTGFRNQMVNNQLLGSSQYVGNRFLGGSQYIGNRPSLPNQYLNVKTSSGNQLGNQPAGGLMPGLSCPGMDRRCPSACWATDVYTGCIRCTCSTSPSASTSATPTADPASLSTTRFITTPTSTYHTGTTTKAGQINNIPSIPEIPNNKDASIPQVPSNKVPPIPKLPNNKDVLIPQLPSNKVPPIPEIPNNKDASVPQLPSNKDTQIPEIPNNKNILVPNIPKTEEFLVHTLPSMKINTNKTGKANTPPKNLQPEFDPYKTITNEVFPTSTPVTGTQLTTDASKQPANVFISPTMKIPTRYPPTVSYGTPAAGMGSHTGSVRILVPTLPPLLKSSTSGNTDTGNGPFQNSLHSRLTSIAGTHQTGDKSTDSSRPTMENDGSIVDTSNKKQNHKLDNGDFQEHSGVLFGLTGLPGVAHAQTGNQNGVLQTGEQANLVSKSSESQSNQQNRIQYAVGFLGHTERG